MILALVLAAACSGDCRAQSLFQTMERKLLSAMPLQLEVRSHAEGAVRADATSDVSVGPATRVHAKGAFMGTPFERDFDERTTPDLRDGLVIGLSRMGLLHNVVNLSQGNGIDHASGGAREWLEPVNFRRVKGGVAYRLRVNGKETSAVTLLIDSKQRPKKRTMVVHFPGGDMRVTETYRFPVVK
ncbi:MAG: hypothetical protein ABR567_02600 [Myxococcales bacterium]|nr:hypothetical protein [Myxococcales bacterium]